MLIIEVSMVGVEATSSEKGLDSKGFTIARNLDLPPPKTIQTIEDVEPENKQENRGLSCMAKPERYCTLFISHNAFKGSWHYPWPHMR